MELLISLVIFLVLWVFVILFDKWRERDLAKSKPWYPQASKVGRIIKP
jgi:hypothetical protein